MKDLRTMFELIAENLQVSLSALPKLARKRTYNLHRYTLMMPAHFKKVRFEDGEKPYNSG